MFRAELILIGFGHVARRFVRLLDERRLRLRDDYGLDWTVTGIATARHGVVHDPAGVDADAAVDAVVRGGSLADLGRSPGGAVLATARDLIARATAPSSARGARPWRIVVETTLLDIHEGQPAIDHVRAAFDGGADVVTANKGPVAFAYADLRDRAAAAGVGFRFEGAVMDGVPVFNLVRETLPAVTIQAVRGVINTTTNHVLVAMEGGRTFEEALGDMQRAGIAEADPAHDVDGWDAAAKIAALANVWLDARTTPRAVERQGIGGLGVEDVRAALAAGRRLKLVAEARREAGGVRTSVAPVALPADDVLARLDGGANALVIETDLIGPIAITQLASGLTQTAYALLSDLVSLRR